MSRQQASPLTPAANRTRRYGTDLAIGAVAAGAAVAVALFGGPQAWMPLVLLIPLLALAARMGLGHRCIMRHYPTLGLSSVAAALTGAAAFALLCIPPLVTGGSAPASWVQLPVRQMASAALTFALVAQVEDLVRPLRPRSIRLVSVAYGFAVLVPLMWPLYDEDRMNARLGICRSNEEKLVEAVLLYASQNGGRLPAAEAWCDQVLPYVKDRRVFHCPEAKEHECSYAYNARLGGRELSSLDGKSGLVVILESDVGWNAHGGPEVLPDRPRHLRSDSYGYLGAHAAPVRREVALGKLGAVLDPGP